MSDYKAAWPKKKNKKQKNKKQKLKQQKSIDKSKKQKQVRIFKYPANVNKYLHLKINHD